MTKMVNDEGQGVPEVFFSSEQCNIVFQVMDGIEGRSVHPQFDKFFLAWNELRNFFVEQQSLFVQFESQELSGPEGEGFDDDFVPPPPPIAPQRKVQDTVREREVQVPRPPKQFMRPGFEEEQKQVREPPKLVPKAESGIVKPLPKVPPKAFSVKGVMSAITGRPPQSRPVVEELPERVVQNSSGRGRVLSVRLRRLFLLVLVGLTCVLVCVLLRWMRIVFLVLMRRAHDF